MESVPISFFDVALRLEMTLWEVAERGVLGTCDVKLGSVLALRALARRGNSARVQDLADDLAITVGAASKIVDRLEVADLVVRTPHVTDGRSHTIVCTKQGVKVLERALAAMHEALEAQLAALGGDDELRRLCGKLGRAIH